MFMVVPVHLCKCEGFVDLEFNLGFCHLLVSDIYLENCKGSRDLKFNSDFCHLWGLAEYFP